MEGLSNLLENKLIISVNNEFKNNRESDIISSYSTTKIVHDKWHQWSNKSIDTPFKSAKKCIGNGEHKLAKELGILDIGGQNSTVDLVHHTLGHISVKDMTNDDCTLGTEGCQYIRSLFRKAIYPLSSWSEKYQDKCEYSREILNKLKLSYGSSRITIFEGIDRFELSNSNFDMLNKILEEIKKKQKESELPSMKSEYITDICEYLKENSLIEHANQCVRKEAINMTLIIVHKIKGWMIIKDISKITCPRITRGAPRININYN